MILSEAVSVLSTWSATGSNHASVAGSVADTPYSMPDSSRVNATDIASPAAHPIRARLQEAPAPIDCRRGFLVDPHLARVSDDAANLARLKGRIALLRDVKTQRRASRRHRLALRPTAALFFRVL